MPSAESVVQIIPFYAQPHVHTVIFDHTQYEETVAVRPDPEDLPFATLVLTGADQGIDNTLVKVCSLQTKQAIFGKSNYKKYGQSSLQAENHFNGDTAVWFCRVLPDNATYANMIVVAKFRKGKILDELNQETGKVRLEVKFETVHVTKDMVPNGALTDDTIYEAAQKLTSMKADPETGYMTLPLFYVRSIGRGRYGNNYSVSVTRDTDAEKDFAMKMYAFNLIENGVQTRVRNSFAGSLYETTRYNMSTLISDVLDQYSTGSVPISITPFSDNWETIFEFYNTIVAENAQYVKNSGEAEEDMSELKIAQSLRADTFDLLFGKQLNTRTGEEIPYYRNYTVQKTPWVEPELTIPEGVSMVTPDPDLGTSGTSPDGTSGWGEVDMDDIDREDELIAQRKPVNLRDWNTATVGSRVMVCGDPLHDGAQWVYTVISIDAETGEIVYDEGEGVSVDVDQYTGVNLSADVGQMLVGGSDGDFEEITVNGVTRAPNAAEMKLLLSREYVKVLRGQKDRKILSPMRVNLDFIMDANYNMTCDDSLEISGTTPLYGGSTVLTAADHQLLSVVGGDTLKLDWEDLNVKKALYDLNEFRNRNGMTINPAEGAGCSIYLDCGLVGLKNIGVNYELVNVINSMKEFTGRATSIDLGYYEIFDPISRKRIQVTAPFFMAKKLVPHMKQYGINKPFTYNYATLTAIQRDSMLQGVGDMIRGTFLPDIDLIDWDVKEMLYTNRINYYVTVDEGRTVQRAVQNTRQLEASALLEENNVRVLNTLKKGLEKACRGYLYEWNKPEVRKAYTTAQMDIYRPWIGTFVEDLEIKFTANEWEQERMIMHCYVVVKFIDIVKRIILEINIERPEYGSDEE